jgi:alpha-1,2-mannosyltransferase
VTERGRVATLTIATTTETTTETRRVAVRALTVAGLGALVVAFLSVAAARHGFFDLRVYYGAISFWVNDGGQLYDYLLPKTEYGFTYPPFAAVVMAPMAFLNWHGAITVSVALSVVAMSALVYWLVGPLIVRRGWPRWFAFAISLELAAAMEPVRETVNFGQVNLVLLALVAFDVLVLMRGGHRLSGIGIGLATAIKLTPGVFIIYLLVTRRWRAAAVSCGTAAAATWLAATIAPDASRVFWTDAVWNTDRVGSTAFVSNQSLNGIVSRLDPLDPSVSLWAALALLSFAIWAVRVRRAVDYGDDVAALALTGIFGCLLSPITWVHHLVWALPAVTLLLDHSLDTLRSAWSRRRLFLLAVVSYALLSSRAVWAFEYHYTGWGLLGANLYVGLLCGLLIVLPLRQRRGTQTMTGTAGRPTAADLPDLVDLDRKVNAAFDAKDAGLPLEDSLTESRSLVGARQP